MPKPDVFCIILLTATLLACQGPSEQPRTSVSREFFASGPQLVRIPLKSPEVAVTLMNAGVDVLVIEEDYLVARLASEQVSTVETMSLTMSAVEESDLVQRLVRITLASGAQVNQVSDLGIDIWEVTGDTVLAQVFDKHIRQIRNQGHSVEIVQKNVLDTVRK